MNDPLRLRDESADGFERALLSSVRDDGPSARDRQNALAALGLTTAAVTTGASVWAGSSVAKWTAIVALGGGVAAVAVRATVLRAPTASPSTTTSLRGGMASSEPRDRTTIAPPEEPSRGEAPAADASRMEEETGAVRKGDRIHAVPGVTPRPASSSLSEEVRLIERVRQMLSAGDPKGALGLLSEYSATPGPKLLGDEARVLRIDALMKSGATGAARDLAKRYLVRHPNGVHAQRIRSLVGLRGDQTNP